MSPKLVPKSSGAAGSHAYSLPPHVMHVRCKYLCGSHATKTTKGHGFLSLQVAYLAVMRLLSKYVSRRRERCISQNVHVRTRTIFLPASVGRSLDVEGRIEFLSPVRPRGAQSCHETQDRGCASIVRLKTGLSRLNGRLGLFVLRSRNVIHPGFHVA